MNKKGFTLVELLVVVGILALLAAVAVPLFTGITEKAKQGTDIASSAEIANAINLYNNENSGNKVTQTEVDGWSTQADVEAKLGVRTPKLAPDNFADAIDRITINDDDIALVNTSIN